MSFSNFIYFIQRFHLIIDILDCFVILKLSFNKLNVQIHGVLNAVSWGLLMPIGVIIARYLKVFKSAGPAWFYLHVSCQFSAYIVGVAGWATGIKLGSESAGVVLATHRTIGILIFCLGTLQVSSNFPLSSHVKKCSSISGY